jgi:hypothetical protein
VLIKTELNNNIQEFSVYSEVLNKYGSHWTLLNKLEGGSIQPLSKEVLLDVFKYIVVNPDLEFTYFLNITDIKINDITNSIVLVSPGGEFVLETLKNEYNTDTEFVIEPSLRDMNTFVNMLVLSVPKQKTEKKDDESSDSDVSKEIDNDKDDPDDD